MSMLQCAPAKQNDEPTPDTSTNVGQDDGENAFGFGFVQTGFTLIQGQQSARAGLDKNWILLDSQSNVDIFCNSKLLTNIRKVPKGHHLVLRSNGGSMETHMIGDVRGYGTVWFNPNSLANILSFANVRKKFQVQLETGPLDPSPTINVTKKDGDVMSFIERDLGLYVHDVLGKNDMKNQRKTNSLLKANYDYVFVTTVESLENQFSLREVKEAKRARSLYVTLGRPSHQQFLKVLDTNFINNCPITKQDAERAYYIYGQDLATLKGKTTRSNPPHVRPSIHVPVPSYVRQWHNNVTICIDILYINNIPFFHSISRTLKFRTIEFLPSRKYKHLLLCLQNIINLYESREFVISNIHGDPEFECLQESFHPIQFYIGGKNDHIPEVERSIWTIKERFRSAVNGLPYTHYTKVMIVSLAYECCRLLNILPSFVKNTTHLCPLSIVCGIPIDFECEIKILVDQL